MQNLSQFFPSIRRQFRLAEAYSEQLWHWNDRETEEIQVQKIQAIWNDCITDVPYYRNLVGCGAAPKRIETWKDFQAIPELNRNLFQRHGKDFIRLSGPPDLFRMTGGSTGDPIRFGIFKAEDETLRILKLTLWLRVGYTPNSRLFLIWGHGHLLGKGWRRHWNHALRQIKDELAGYRRANAYSLWPERCREIARKMMAFRPAGLIGYASALDYFLRVTKSYHAEFRKLGLNFVMPCAEPAPKPDTYGLMREVFNCPIIQEFGGVDFGQVGMKVDDQPFEVFPDQNILEAIPPDSNDTQSGAAVVTTLYRRYTPLIRYRQGDLIEGVRRLKHGHVTTFRALAGRANDMVELSSGRQIHSVAFLHCVHQEPAVLNTQLVLDASGVQLRIVTASGFDAACERRIRHRLGQLAPELEDIPFVLAPDVETSVAGKRRWFVDKRARGPSVK